MGIPGVVKDAKTGNVYGVDMDLTRILAKKFDFTPNFVQVKLFCCKSFKVREVLLSLG